jgi:hypothetical protein
MHYRCAGHREKFETAVIFAEELGEGEGGVKLPHPIDFLSSLRCKVIKHFGTEVDNIDNTSPAPTRLLHIFELQKCILYRPLPR